MRKIKIFFLALLLTASSFKEGEELFLQDKPEQARTLLEEALNENPENENIYLYLSIVYEQLNDPQRSIQILKRGLSVATRHKDLLYYNLGNSLFKLLEYTLAEQMYSNALEANGQLEDAHLNRANARLELEDFPGARDDYIRYLKMAPDSPQREEIEELIRLLSEILDEAEHLRQEEITKQKALMNEVLNSLKNASEDTRNLSAGTEQIEEYYEEIDILD
ncbi:hypothetical protein ES703_89641 [subsurface metagenome]